MLTGTQLIILLTAIISIAGFSIVTLKDRLLCKPYLIKEKNQWYRFFTSGLIHADWEHLLFNMFTLFLFGQTVENHFSTERLFFVNGKSVYLLLYFSALPISLITTYWRYNKNPRYASLGASGAVSAVLFTAILLDPTIKIGLFILPPIIPGFLFGPLYLLLSSYLGKRGKDNINHAAHISGAIYGVIFTLAADIYVFSSPIILENFIASIKAYLQ